MERGEGEMPVVPITVRQLEAIVRISEALARMQLRVDATTDHVELALHLFRVSTMDATRAGDIQNLQVELHMILRCSTLLQLACDATPSNALSILHILQAMLVCEKMGHQTHQPLLRFVLC